MKLHHCVMVLVWAGAAVGSAEDLSQIMARLRSDDAAERGEAKQQLHQWTAKVSAPDQIEERAKLEQALLGPIGDRTLPPAVRLALIVPLETVGSSNAVSALLPLLSEPDAELRDAARRALEINPSVEASTALLSALDATQDPSLRKGLLHALGMRRSVNAIPALARALDDPALREIAASALARIGGLPALNALQRSAATSTPSVIMAMAQAARRAGGAGRSAWLRIAGDPQAPASARALAVAGLIEFEADPAEAVRRVAAALADPSVQVRTAAVAAAEPRRGPALSAALTSVWARLSTDAKLGALTLMDAAAAEFIATQCESDDPIVASLAVETLARVQGEAATSRLLGLAASDTPARAAATRALESLPGGSVVTNLLATARSGEPARRAAALLALARRRDPSASALLGSALQDPDPSVSRAAVEGSKITGSTEHLETLVRLGLSGRADALEAARAILVRTTDRAPVVARLIELANTISPDARPPLVELIAAAGGPQALAWTRSQLSGPAKVRESAVRALANWADADALAPLRELVSSAETPEPHRRLALRGIARLVSASTNAPAELRCEAAIAALGAAADRADRIAVIAALGSVSDRRAAVALREELQRHPEVQAEIWMALAGLAEALHRTDKAFAKELAQQVMAAPSAPPVARSKAEALAR